MPNCQTHPSAPAAIVGRVSELACGECYVKVRLRRCTAREVRLGCPAARLDEIRSRRSEVWRNVWGDFRKWLIREPVRSRSGVDVLFTHRQTSIFRGAYIIRGIRT